MNTIQPTKVTNFSRNDAELERFSLFCVLVAGKNSDRTSALLSRILNRADREGLSPFEYLRSLGEGMSNFLVANRVGQYTRITSAFRGLLALPSLRDATLGDLLAISGIGPKTARFFLLHSRPNQRFVILDTHILKWLRDEFELPKIPLSTPQEPRYTEIERVALDLMRVTFGELTLAEADLLLWARMSGRLEPF